MLKISVKSKNLEFISYNQSKLELSVWFLNKKSDTEHYVYEGVEPDVFGELMLADSKGKYFFKNIKNVYEFRKVE